jgi:N-acetylglucosaminyl-diphospho-decaprenol L-rhamnosyltransferase
MRPPHPTVHILILNFNGRDLLERFLPSVVEASTRSRYPCRVSVIDNASTDGSVRYLQEAYDGVVGVFALTDNRVLCAYNEVVAPLNDDYVILLNNDIKATPGFVDPLISCLQQEERLFMATPRVYNAQGEAEGAYTRAYVKWGLFWASARFAGFADAAERRAPTFAAGIGAFDRRRFTEIGGYDDLYLPGTLEDSDLCLRAWMRGYSCVYEPASVIYHMGQVSFHRRFGVRGTRVINARNLFLFMWKNIDDPWCICAHLCLLPARLLYAVCTGRCELFIGFLQALRMMPAALRRREGREEPVIGAREVFAQFRRP